MAIEHSGPQATEHFTASTETATVVDSAPAGYELLGELARGGMGRVLAGRELALDREVAIKTLLPGANATRFLTEAKITARLQHPSIPPVYALGQLADGSPFLAMKLVRGQTLADELKRRPQPLHDLPRFLQIFEQIAQAVGFAHAQRIIHRDLKPANVMVGAFGEVQVMDWGLAKDLSQASPAVPKPTALAKTTSNTISPATVDWQPETPNQEGEQTGAEAGLDTPPEGEQTGAGAILGTPNYMAPEQARGDVVDARADVFALGGILCAILTGKAVFGGTSLQEMVKQAAAGDTAEALARLAACGAEREVVDLAKRCLTVIPSERPADGQAVTNLVAAYRQGVEARLKQAETDRARAETRAAEQAKRRRVVQWAGGLIAGVLVLGIIGTTVGLFLVSAAAEKERAANATAQAEKTAAEQARDAEEQAKTRALKRLAQVEEGVEQFAGLLLGIDPRAEEKGGKPLYKQLLERAEQAADKLSAEAVGDAQAVARLQTIYGNTLRELGNAPKAVELLEKARTTRERELGPNHPDTSPRSTTWPGRTRPPGRPARRSTCSSRSATRR
jgi:eukaryotic-like serine/threonine-protein kinase